MSASEIKSNLKKVAENMWNDHVEKFQALMATAEAKAHANAPWTDRTGNARSSIEGGVVATPEVAIGYLDQRYMRLSKFYLMNLKIYIYENEISISIVNTNSSRYR
jgi:hypothetical protein